ncbi:aromatic amino acid ammonia-lyase [Saccharopolyspora spinosa]|uniref:aromatic amino acid ammonia-lyase n=1 Tax=Saccharopolyspora spinosa TaxID=60894 RepID=UPI0002F46E20|nr:aromatic amino acid ammonia-lyase [Saccharopolyspora spinosa]
MLGDDSLTPAATSLWARSPAAGTVRIADTAAVRMADSVRVRDKLIATGNPIYGVTTGFGDSARFHLSSGKTTQLQRNLITYHLNGTGPYAPEDVVRATMLVRANCLARGYSGIRREVVQLLIDCLRHDITPLIPERGSVGASGDLVPLCYLADMLLGSGQVRVAGTQMSAAAALRAADLVPVTFEAKEGLALINGTSFMSGFAVLATHDAAEIANVADLCTALTAEALLGNRGHFHPLIHQQKPQPGQIRSSARTRALLTGSRLCTDAPQVLEPDAGPDGFVALGRAIQDRYSIRCAPHVNGVLLDTLDWVTRWLNVEINSTNDNPLFDPLTAEVHNGGNFYGGHVGHGMDSLKLAVASVGDLLDRQMALLVDTKFNHGLTANLTSQRGPSDPDAGLHHGFKGMQLAASALAGEALKLTNPATAFSRSTEAHNQDKVSMGTIAARDARTVVELVREITAITLLAGCQAVDLRGAGQLGHGTKAAYDVIREHVPFVDVDRRLDGDLATVAELIRSGTLGDVIREHTES